MITWIKNLIRRNQNITLCKLWYKLRINRDYSRHIESLYRVLRKLDSYSSMISTPANNVNFIKRCISHFGYKALEIQTDNGTEFTWN